MRNTGKVLRHPTSMRLAWLGVSFLLAAGCDSSVESGAPPRSSITVESSSILVPRESRDRSPKAELHLLRQRELQRPRQAENCPVTTSHKLAHLYGRLQGTGPVYPVSNGRLRVPFPAPKTSIWSGSPFSGFKVRWIAERRYNGPVLVRGFAWEGHAPVKFNDRLRPFLFSAGYKRSHERWHEYAAWHYIRFRQAGCYALQIDGREFSEIVVLRVVPE